MIERIAVYQGDSVDPHYNLAVEQYLMETVPKGTVLLYLWQNKNTIVIGRNQSAWRECRTTLLAEEGGKLARRLSGGGAVFHDLGNLNFTFLVNQEDYDQEKQFSVIVEACRLLGIPAEMSGRNDVLAMGRKFSGNAFYSHHGKAYHHGTLMVDVDMDKLGRYLSPSKAKMESKGVQSVRSRVVNLKELAPALTVSCMADQMVAAFENVYGFKAAQLTEENLDREAVKKLTEHNADWDWLYGNRAALAFSCEGRFPWGGVELELQVEMGKVEKVQVYTDSMDWHLADDLKKAFWGCHFTQAALCDAIRREICDPAVQDDLVNLLKQQEI